MIPFSIVLCVVLRAVAALQALLCYYFQPSTDSSIARILEFRVQFTQVRNMCPGTRGDLSPKSSFLIHEDDVSPVAARVSFIIAFVFQSLHFSYLY